MMRPRLFANFYFREGACQFPTVSLIGSDGRTIQCHRTITREEWAREPWYGRLAIIRLYRLDGSPRILGHRLWIYTRWGSCHFDLYLSSFR